MQAITVGLDIAKSVFQVHGVDAHGQVVIRRQLKRRYVLAFFEKLAPCVIGIEACASSHHWSRRLQALGHTVRLMPPAYVKPYVKRQKNDATDAEAICEAVGRANMRFVPTKTPEQQSGLVLHRTRHLFIRQQTSVINAIRAHCADLRPDVIFCHNTVVVSALARETQTIPIVFTVALDPVGSGFAANLAHPGGHITGFTNNDPAMGGKWVELLREIAPRTAHVAFMFNPATALPIQSYLPSVQAAA